MQRGVPGERGTQGEQASMRSLPFVLKGEVIRFLAGHWLIIYTLKTIPPIAV